MRALIVDVNCVDFCKLVYFRCKTSHRQTPGVFHIDRFYTSIAKTIIIVSYVIKLRNLVADLLINREQQLHIPYVNA